MKNELINSDEEYKKNMHKNQQLNSEIKYSGKRVSTRRKSIKYSNQNNANLHINNNKKLVNDISYRPSRLSIFNDIKEKRASKNRMSIYKDESQVDKTKR